MKIELGKYEIVHSGIVIQIGDNPIKFTLPDNIEGDFLIIFKFSKNEKEAKPSIRLIPIDKFTMQIDYLNFNGSQSLGNIDLIHLGTLEKKNLYLNFRVSELIGTGMTIIYNFITEKEVSHAS